MEQIILIQLPGLFINCCCLPRVPSSLLCLLGCSWPSKVTGDLAGIIGLFWDSCCVSFLEADTVLISLPDFEGVGQAEY